MFRCKMHGKTSSFAVMGTVLLLLIASCGRVVEEGPNSDQGNGTVALFFTDNISNYKQVITTVNSVRLVNSGAQEVCEMMSKPATLDITNLGLDTQLINRGACAAGQYNRIDIAFLQDVRLMDNQDNTLQCLFTSYLDASNQVTPVQCDPVTHVCTLSIRTAARQGGIPVLRDELTNLALDFDLQQFTVTGSNTAATCSVTMKVIPLDTAALNSSIRAQSVTGSISALDVVTKTFTLTNEGTVFFVDYSGVLSSLQPDLGVLLRTAADQGLSVKVLTANIDLTTNRIVASRVYAIVEGTVSGLLGLPGQTFTLTYQPMSPASAVLTLPVNYKANQVDGIIAEGSWVSLKLDGYDSKNGEYLAAYGEVLTFGMVIEN